jgi:hypothetical protein
MNNLWDLLPCFKNKEDEISFDPISYPDLEPKQTAEPVFPLKEIKIIKQYHSNGNLRRKYTLIGNLKDGMNQEFLLINIHSKIIRRMVYIMAGGKTEYLAFANTIRMVI